MSTVTVPTALGGSGITYSDDGTGARDMRDGGHRQWLLPMVGEQIAAAQTAVTAAASTVGAASTQASSTTSLTIGTGTQCLTVETGKNIIAGMPVRIASTATPTNRMDGTVTSYNSGTGALVVSVDRANGSGTEASWRVFLTGAGISTAELLEAEFGGAGPTITTATALTATTARVRPVAMTANNQAVTLPDATTLQLGGPQVVLPNTGTFQAPVRDTAGGLITVIEPGGVAELHLLSQASSAGAWVATGRGLSPALTILDHTLPSTYTQAVDGAVRLTDTKSLHFCRDASNGLYVLAADHSTAPGTVGTPTLIATSNTFTHAFRISDTKAMVARNAGSVNNITVSGTACIVSSNANVAALSQATFGGPPLIAQMGANNDVFVAIDVSGGAVRAQAVDCSGTNPSAGSSVNIVGSGGQAVIGIYRVSDTTALALYVDDSGTAGSPRSIRGVVLSLSGTTITVNTSAGVNDVVDVSGGSPILPSVQLTATSYVVGYYVTSGTTIRAVHVGVNGTTVTFGSELTVETASLAITSSTEFNANRFQPNLFRLSDTTVLYTYGSTSGGTPIRHVVLTNSGGTLTAGAILYGLWDATDGGNFQQASDGFIAFNAAQNVAMLYGVSVSGTSLNINGTTTPPGQLGINPDSSLRFGLSGGVQGVLALGNQSASRFLMGNARLLLYRNRAGAAPVFLGQVSPPNTGANSIRIPVEVAPSKAAFTYASRAQNGSATAAIKVVILEFAA